MKTKTILLIAAIIALFGFPLVVENPYYIHLVETILIYAVLLFGLDIFDGPPTGVFGQFDGKDRVYSELRYDF